MRMMETEVKMQMLIQKSEFLVCIDQCCLEDSCIV
jgi:hypothetical protein